MNGKLGKIGMQEALCLAGTAACVSAIFTPDSGLLYAQGNSAYVSMLLSALLALAVFLLTTKAMRRSNADTLFALMRFALGPFFSRAASLALAIMLMVSGAALFDRFLLMLGRFVFPEVMEWEILIYLLITMLLLIWLGFEGLGRTARLFAAIFVLTLAGMLLLGVSSYEAHRLAPLLGDGSFRLMASGVRDSALFLPALVSLMAVSKGMHGVGVVRKLGCYVAALGGVVASVCQLCLGMTYGYRDLAQMHSPMYRLTMGFKTGGYTPKLDTLLLFGWTMAGSLSAGFYIFAASFLYMQAFDQEDIRPGLAVFSAAAGGLALMMHSGLAWTNALLLFFRQYSFLLLMLPVVLAALLGLARCRRGDRVDPPMADPHINEETRAPQSQPEVQNG